MPIERWDGGVTITGEAISFARLLVLRGALKLEMQGIQVSNRRASTVLRQQFGMRGTPERLLAQLEALIQQRKQEEQHLR